MLSLDTSTVPAWAKGTTAKTNKSSWMHKGEKAAPVVIRSMLKDEAISELRNAIKYQLEQGHKEYKKIQEILGEQDPKWAKLREYKFCYHVKMTRRSMGLSAGTRWPPRPGETEDQRIVRLHNAGYSKNKITGRLNCTEQVYFAALALAGVKLPRPYIKRK